MKERIIAFVFVICVMLCGLNGCKQESLKETTAPVPEAVQPTDVETKIIPETVGVYMEEQTTQDVKDYASVLEAYHKALTEGWNMAQYAEAGLSYMATYCPDKSQVFFAFQDLDGDGDRELLIGPAVNDEFLDKQVFEAYDLMDGVPRQLFCGFERIRYYLCDRDGAYTILREGSGGAAISYWHHARYNGDGLTLLDGIVYNADSNPDAPWFCTEDWDSEKCVAMDGETAEKTVAEYDSRKTNIHRGFPCVYTFDQLD